MDIDESPRSLDSLGSDKTIDGNNNEDIYGNNDVDIDEDENNDEDIDESESEDFKLPSARLKYEEICETLNNEERKILDLEKRRKQLQLDMEKLQREIELEKLQFHEAIDYEIEKNNEDMNNSQSSRVDIFNFDKDDITTQLDDFRQHLEQSREQNISKREDDDEDIKRLKSNLLNYKKGLDIPEKEKITRDKRKESAKLFRKQLNQVKEECTEKIEQLHSIQKDIDHFTDTGDDRRQL